jgi:hypothetical protein
VYSTGIPVQESLGLGTLRLDPTDKRAKLAMELTATSVASESVKNESDQGSKAFKLSRPLTTVSTRFQTGIKYCNF